MFRREVGRQPTSVKIWAEGAGQMLARRADGLVSARESSQTANCRVGRIIKITKLKRGCVYKKDNSAFETRSIKASQGSGLSAHQSCCTCSAKPQFHRLLLAVPAPNYASCSRSFTPLAPPQLLDGSHPTM